MVKSARMKRKGIFRAKQFTNQTGFLRIDLGCGLTKRSGFVGLDVYSNADIPWDIMWGLPFEDNSVIEIRADHFFEHLELTQLVEVLRECKRVLISGGKLDFTVPHIDPYLDAYLQNDFNFFKEKIFDVPKGQEDLYNTCFDRMSWLLHRSGEHKSMFDKESILNKVKLAGFNNVTTREFDEDKDIKLRFSSLYVVAVK